MTSKVDLSRHTFIISDVHLTEPKSNLNIFHAEDSFEEFLAETIPSTTAGDQATLVVLGDFIDFVRLEPWPPADDRPRRVGATEAESVKKVDRAVSANERVFGALARFVQSHRLVIVPGNHDADFFWKGVCDLVTKRLSAPTANVQCVPDWEIESNGLFMSHGHQFNYDNRFDASPPFVDYGGVAHLERCWGTYFLESVYNLIHYFAPYVNMVHPTSHAVLLGLRNIGWDKIPPPIVARLVAFFVKHGARLVGEHMLGSNSTGSGIDETLSRLSLAPPDSVLAETAKILAAEPDAEFDLDLSMGLTLESPPGTLGRTDETVIERYAEAQLERESVFAAVFGHTHRALGPSPHKGGQFVNTGTWTGALFLDESSPHDHESLVVASRTPTQKLTYAHVDLHERSIERCTVR